MEVGINLVSLKLPLHCVQLLLVTEQSKQLCWQSWHVASAAMYRPCSHLRQVA